MENLSFAPESEQYMVQHMNEQYASSLLMYVKVYGGLWEATDANMLQLDKAGMELEAILPGETRRIRIPFDHHLQDEGDAQQTLVELSFKAREILAQRGRTNG
jgi:putative heme iron utilization protein